jgi:hypothetical protein
MGDKDTAYQSSYVDIGWCREPLVLVAKNTSDGTSMASCVYSDSVYELIKRGWAQDFSQAVQEFHKEVKEYNSTSKLVYRDDNAKPVDTFRASLFGLPHADNLEALGDISAHHSNKYMLKEVISSELLDEIKPPYSTEVQRVIELGITLQEYQDRNRVCEDGYDYYFSEELPTRKVKEKYDKWEKEYSDQREFYDDSIGMWIKVIPKEKHGYKYEGVSDYIRDKQYVVVQFNC